MCTLCGSRVRDVMHAVTAVVSQREALQAEQDHPQLLVLFDGKGLEKKKEMLSITRTRTHAPTHL